MTKHLNIEIKARCPQHDKIRNEILKFNSVIFKGIDYQTDTYFNVNFGRLKLREGNIENYLVFYERENTDGPKESNVIIYENCQTSTLKEILTKSLGKFVEVYKKREIFFIENVKFHLDTVKDLGTFVEIEAIDKDGDIGKDKLLEQCNYYLNIFGIDTKDLIAGSYSDMISNKNMKKSE